MAHRRHRRAAAANMARYWEDIASQRWGELEDIYGKGSERGQHIAQKELPRLWEAAPELKGYLTGGTFMDSELAAPHRAFNTLGPNPLDRARKTMTITHPEALPQHSSGVTLSGMLRGAEDDPSKFVTLNQEAMAPLVGAVAKEEWWESQDPIITKKQQELEEANANAANWWKKYSHHEIQEAKSKQRIRSIVSTVASVVLSLATGGALLPTLAGAAYSNWRDYAKFRSAKHGAERKVEDTLSGYYQPTGTYGTESAGFGQLDIFGMPLDTTTP